MKLSRRWTAPLSAIFLMIVAGLAFAQQVVQHTGTENPPPILDPQFELWAWDSQFGGSRPLVWELEYSQGSEDQISLRKTDVAGRTALEIKLLQDGGDGWVYVYLRQSLDGARLRALLSKEVGVLVFLESTCACKQASPSQPTVFGIETNDGEHTLRFLFSETRMEPQQTPSSRTIFLLTVPGEWTYHRIDVAGEYENAKWLPEARLPERLRFGVTFQAPPSSTGWHVGYLHGFSVSTVTHPITTQSGAAATSQSTSYVDKLRISVRESDVINPPCPHAWNCRARQNMHEMVTRV